MRDLTLVFQNISPKNIVHAFVIYLLPESGRGQRAVPSWPSPTSASFLLRFAQRDGTIKAIPIDRQVRQSSSPRAASFSSLSGQSQIVS